MKKIMMILAAATLCFASCQKDPVIPVTPIQDDDDDDIDDDEDYLETTVTCTIELMAELQTNDYGVGTMTMPGDKILEFFDMTAEEFYHAMGTYSGDAGSTTQENNTINFGVCTGNDHDQMNFCPSSSNNFGCWMDANSAVCTWGDDAVFYHESLCEWGLDDPGEENLAAMWDFAVGFYPSHNSYAAGDQVKATYFFQKDAEDADEKDLYCYVEMIFDIVAPKDIDLNIIDSQILTYTKEYDGDYSAYSIEEDIDLDAVASCIGCSVEDAVVYAINSDDSVYANPGTNFWFSIDGDVMGWGEGCGIDINYDNGYWSFCNYPDETLAGQMCYGAIAFTNPDTMDAYAIYVAVEIPGIDYTTIDVLVSYEAGESEYVLTENNIAAICAALGV